MKFEDLKVNETYTIQSKSIYSINQQPFEIKVISIIDDRLAFLNIKENKNTVADFSTFNYLYQILEIDSVKNCTPETVLENAKPCTHGKKYINHALHQKFWVCPECKKDLGNV